MTQTTSASKPKSGWRRLPASSKGRWALSIWTAGALALTLLLLLPWLNVVAGNYAPVAASLTPLWVIVAVIALAGACAFRRWLAALIVIPALVLALAASWLLLHRPSVPMAVAKSDQHRSLTVLSLNAEYGEADPGAVMRLIRSHRPDVVVFVEMTAAKLTALDEAGLTTLLPNRTAGMVDDGSRGSIILSKYPVTTVDGDSDLGPYDLQSPVAEVKAPGDQVLVHAVHTYPPLADGASQWRPQLNKLGDWQRAQTAQHIIMAGDFNAGVTHPAFRQLARGMVDAYPSLHGSLHPSWPYEGPLPPFVQIDHVLTKGFVPKTAKIDKVPGTDHAAIVTQLSY